MSTDPRLDAARVEALYRVSKPAYVATLANAGILLVVLWGPYTAGVLLAWFGAMLAVTLARVGLHFAYLRLGLGGDALRWEARLALGALASGAVWSFAPAVFFASGDPLLQLAVVFVVGGSLIGAAGVYAPSPAAFYAFGALPLAAVTAQLFAQGGRIYMLLGLMVIVFGVVMVRVFRDLYRGIVRTLSTQLENERLVARLARSETQLRDAIESFPEGIAIFDEQDQLLMCNEEYAKYYGSGRSADALTGTLYRDVAAAAFDAEIVPAAFAGRREDWIQERLQRRASGERLPRQYQMRDGSWKQGLFVRTRRGGTVSAFSDITGIHQAQAAYQAVVAEEKVILDTLPVGVAFVERNVVVRCNQRLEQMLGYAPGELEGQSTRKWFRTDEQWHKARQATYASLKGTGLMEGDARVRRKDGTRLWCHVVARALDPDSPPDAAIIFAFADVDQRVAAEQALQESVERLRLAVDAADLVYWEWDRDSGKVHWGGRPGAAQGTDYNQARTWTEYRDRVHPEDREAYLAAVNAAWERGGTYTAEYRMLGRDGSVNWISARGKTLADATGRPYRMIGVSQNINERKRHEEEVRFLAYHDTLTGLPNRRLLDDRLKQAVYAAQRREAKVAAMLIDLDDFKRVNDSLGHRAGDAVLREVAQRLAACVRKADTLARHGGDEFVVVFPDLALESDCQVVAEKILRSLEAEFRVDGRSFSLGASIGISIFPSDAPDSEALLRNADVAMYRAKELGRNHYRFYGR